MKCQTELVARMVSFTLLFGKKIVMVFKLVKPESTGDTVVTAMIISFFCNLILWLHQFTDEKEPLCLTYPFY